MDRVADRIFKKLNELRTKELPHDLLALYVDVKFVKSRENKSMAERAVYVAIGLDPDGNKSVLGFDVKDREDLDGWKSFLSGLANRGLNKVDVVVSDNFPGLDKVIATVFPSSFHLTLSSDELNEGYPRKGEKVKSQN